MRRAHVVSLPGIQTVSDKLPFQFRCYSEYIDFDICLGFVDASKLQNGSSWNPEFCGKVVGPWNTCMQVDAGIYLHNKSECLKFKILRDSSAFNLRALFPQKNSHAALTSNNSPSAIHHHSTINNHNIRAISTLSYIIVTMPKTWSPELEVKLLLAAIRTNPGPVDWKQVITILKDDGEDLTYEACRSVLFHSIESKINCFHSQHYQKMVKIAGGPANKGEGTPAKSTTTKRKQAPDADGTESPAKKVRGRKQAKNSKAEAEPGLEPGEAILEKTSDEDEASGGVKLEPDVSEKFEAQCG